MSARTVGSYELEGLLGEGGIGQVYAAQDRVLGRHVAIKTLRPELSRDRNFVDRFYNEAKSLAALNHTNIATLYALHAEGDEAFMVMELVQGHTIEALLGRVGRLTVRDTLAILAQAIPGIRYAHRRGVVHRDLKPANLMLTDEGVVKIMDFGIARVRGSQHLTQVGEFVGTFVYASPEQIKGEEVDERSDLYSLAIVCYRMLAGKAPFASDNEYALMTAHLQSPPPPLVGQVPDIPEAVEAALMRALAKRPEDRFPSVEEFGRAIGARALREESADLLQQLYARVFDSDDPEKTVIASPRRFEPSTAPTLPSNRGDWRLTETALPGLSDPTPVPSPPRANGADRQAAAPQHVAVLRAPRSPAARGPGARTWLIGAGALAVPLMLGAGYYLFAAGGAAPRVAPAPPAAAEQPRAPLPPSAEVAKTAPAPIEPAKAEVPPLPPAPLPVEPVKAEIRSPTPVEPVKSVVQAPPVPPPAPPPVEPVKSVVQAPAAPPPAPPSPVEPAKTAAPTPPPVVEPSKTESPPAPERPAAETKVAVAEPPKPTEPPPPLGPEAMPKPEGEPDLQGRVTGVKGLNEIELDKARWIKIYGIVDRTPQASRHTEALVGYLKPSHNHVVCYKKPADTYRCYSDGQDIARLALLDRLVQLAPNAPAEYRSLLAERR